MQRISPTAGDGNFSLVFRAHDEQTGKRVALKFYYAGPLSREDDYRRECFRRESCILQQLAGQRDILQLVEPLTEFTFQLVDSATGIALPHRIPYFAAELARSDVKNYIYQRATTPLTNLIYFRAMCRGVQRLHQSDICHRDIKPDNFFLMALGGLCLGDFGTATRIDGSEPPLDDRYYFWRGDRRYTAPEMFATLDYADEVDLFCGADMFSLGAILFEMFTKHNLVAMVFSDRWHLNLSRNLGYVPRERRREVFAGLASSLAQRTQLPDIDAFGNPVPDIIRNRLDHLYKGLTNLDYQKRTTDFPTVFLEASRCVEILINEDIYRRQTELRRKWRERRKERRQNELAR